MKIFISVKPTLSKGIKIKIGIFQAYIMGIEKIRNKKRAYKDTYEYFKNMILAKLDKLIT